MQVQKVIEALGYTPKEAGVYLAALALGEAHISDIATKVKLPRTSAQAIVDRLHADGLMNFYVMCRYKYWVAENPQRLLKTLEERQQVVVGALPQLLAMRQQGRRGRVAQTISKQDLNSVCSLVDEISSAVLVTDEDQTILYVNAAWEALFGYALAEVYGKTPRVCQSGKTDRAVYQKMWETLEQGKLFHTDRLIDRDKDGNIFSLIATIFSIRHRGKLLYIQILDTTTKPASQPEVPGSFFATLVAATTVLSWYVSEITATLNSI